MEERSVNGAAQVLFLVILTRAFRASIAASCSFGCSSQPHWELAIRNGARWKRWLFLLLIGMVVPGCTLHPQTPAIRAFMQSNPAYARLPCGPQRVDALYRQAKTITGSDAGALELLGSLAVYEGAKLRHPFNTGLTTEGTLARNDKTGHFFAHAMWQYQDQKRLIPMAKTMGFSWEILGELKSWVSAGDGYDYRDLWANRLGREFADRLYAKRDTPNAQIAPSEIIALAEQFKPEELAEEETQSNNINSPTLADARDGAPDASDSHH